MDVLFRSPLGALLAKPWVDQAGLFGLKRWYFPLSRLWAAANAAGDDTARFRDEIGAPVAAWPEPYLRSVLARNAGRKAAAEAARSAWETSLFGDAPDEDGLLLDRRRRAAATRHLATRASFYPLLFPTRPPSARWEIDPPVRCRARPRAGDRPARQPLRCCRRRRHRRRFAAGDERWLARVLAARADARAAAASAARQ